MNLSRVQSYETQNETAKLQRTNTNIRFTGKINRNKKPLAT